MNQARNLALHPDVSGFLSTTSSPPSATGCGFDPRGGAVFRRHGGARCDDNSNLLSRGTPALASFYSCRRERDNGGVGIYGGSGGVLGGDGVPVVPVGFPGEPEHLPRHREDFPRLVPGDGGNGDKSCSW